QPLASVGQGASMAGSGTAIASDGPAIPNSDRLAAAIRTSSQAGDRLHAELAATDAQIEAVNQAAKLLDGQIAATTARLQAERLELRGLARAIYVQPDSLLVALADSPNLGDFLTRVGDLAVAGFRARSLVRQLGSDSRRLGQDRRAVSAAQARLGALRQKVLDDLSALAAAAAAVPAATVPAAAGTIPGIIRGAFSPQGPGAVNWALKVAYCESGYNPNAVNPGSGTEGLFQFMPSTWARTPWGRDSPFDASANAHAAAWLYQREGGSPWQCKG
ncbi:MAG: transglycosylase SLT domain-containing protein, partial [Candidatus Dormibacteraceae bacterium]